MLRSFLILLLLFCFSGKSFSQSYSKRIEIRTNCDQTQNDTMSIEFYSKTGKVLSRKDLFPSSFNTIFKYDNLDRLIRIEKNRGDANNTFELTKIYYTATDTNRSSDTVFNAKGNAELIRSYTYIDSVHQVLIVAKTSLDSLFHTKEIIQRDEENHELSTSICYGIQSCITNKFHYINGKLSVKEKWMLSPQSSLPVLILNENYVYDETNLLKAVVINLIKDDTENCKERLFYSYY